MLVLSRKLGEKIQIGDDVTITILAIKGRGVRVGIEAPRDARVLRSALQVLDDETAQPPAPVPTPVEPAASPGNAPTRDRRRSNEADRRTGFLVAALGRSSSELVDPQKTPPQSRSSRRSPGSRKRPGLPR